MPVQNLPGLHSGVMPTITPGDPMSRSMGHYGKGHSFAPAPFAAATAGLPGDAAGKTPAPPVRDPKGGMKKNPKFGDMGAGPNGAYGSPRDYGAAGDNS